VLGLTPDLLAPGDAKSSELDPARFSWTRIRGIGDAEFAPAYEVLWREFGAAHEMETREVLAGRFALGTEMQYEIVVAREGGTIAALRDHTAIWAAGEVVVHLSHLLVMEPWRRSGLAGWMRAAPVLVAREVAARQGTPRAPITLVGEMEHDDGSDPKRSIRLKAYERAGFLKVDPAVAQYHQPDFRALTEIDASGGARPLPFQLIIRQVGREGERTVAPERVQRWVHALYSMYGAQFRPQDMGHPLLRLEHYPPGGAPIALLPPTQS
jgi:GNAT superfamily N-acetyltransferase